MSMDTSFKRSFLTAEFKKEHTFTVPHPSNGSNQEIVCEETMHESKLSITLPLELLQTFYHFAIELRDVFNDKFGQMRNTSLLKIYSSLMKVLDTNIETYSQMIRYLKNYKGPSFKPSKAKFRLDSSAIPINLHVQRLRVDSETSWSCITCGAVTAASLRFNHGGLYRIRHNLNINLNEMGRNYMNETLFYTRQKTLEDAKVMIDNLAHQIDSDFEMNHETRLHLFSEVKQLHQLLLDLIQNFPNVNDLVEALCSNGLAQMKKPLIGKSLSKQLESLKEAFVELDTQMATANQISNDQTTTLENAKMSLTTILNMLRGLIKSIYYAQFMGLILASKNPVEIYKHIQLKLRYDIILTQAITIVSTCLLNNIDQSTKQKLEDSWTKYGPIVSYYGLLTCHNDEKGMVEDMHEIWSVFHDHVRFQFVLSIDSNIYTPNVDGHPTDIKVTIPLPSEAFKKLPESYTNGSWFRVNTVYWNVSVNQDTKNGDLSFEESVNRAAFSTISRIVSSETPSQNISDLMSNLKKALDEYPSRKVVILLRRVQSIIRFLNGSSIFACKSGKDRTSMILTFECGVFLKRHFGTSNQQMQDIIDGLRRDGVRRENCRKNIGLPTYYCSPVQLSHMPREFHPPEGTYSHIISS